MLDLFHKRMNGQKAQMHPFTSMREQWTKDANVLTKTQESRSIWSSI